MSGVFLISALVSDILKREKNIIIVSGHYGSGKSLLSVNLALDLKRAKENSPVALCDLDIVNPYFRSADSKELLQKNGVEAIVQQFANTNVDIPSIPPELNTVFERDMYSVLDVGGDDAGARVLGAYEEKIKKYGYIHLCVINFARPLSATAKDAANYVREIEKSSCTKVTAIVNNTNIAFETTKEMFEKSFAKADELSFLLSLPVYSSFVGESFKSDRDIYFMRNLTKQYF